MEASLEKKDEEKEKAPPRTWEEFQFGGNVLCASPIANPPLSKKSVPVGIKAHRLITKKRGAMHSNTTNKITKFFTHSHESNFETVRAWYQ